MTFLDHRAELDQIRQHLDALASMGGHSPPALMAVSKNQPLEKITDVLKAGHGLFGENRVQEALKKWPLLKASFPHAQVHLIGPLQTNKVRDAIALFDGIQTIDRPKIVDKIAAEWIKNPRPIRFFIQVNTGKEPQKSGVVPEDFPALLVYCHQKGLPIIGLMTIPPKGQDPKPYFLSLKALADAHGLSEISMGMSEDYPIAVACGATLVRLGTRLFGTRL